ncbi:hypothetical protein TorRG33x02_260190, partial [Trema orientale]
LAFIRASKLPLGFSFGSVEEQRVLNFLKVDFSFRKAPKIIPVYRIMPMPDGFAAGSLDYDACGGILKIIVVKLKAVIESFLLKYLLLKLNYRLLCYLVK